MKFRYLMMATLFLNAMSFAESQGWLIRCENTGQKIATTSVSLKAKKINVLNSVERNDSSISEHCASGETLQAFYLLKFQFQKAKDTIPSLREAPPNFNPQPPRRVH